MTLCISAGKVGRSGRGHPANCEILECGAHCAPPDVIESHECDGKSARSVLKSGEFVLLRVPVGTAAGKEEDNA